LALCAVGIPLVVLAEVWDGELGRLLTGGASDVAAQTAADALRWMVPASVADLLAGLSASRLAALDADTTGAAGYAVASLAGVALIAARIGSDGADAVYHGVTLTALIAVFVPTVGLMLRAWKSRMPAAAVRRRVAPIRRRFGEFAVGAALPIA